MDTAKMMRKRDKKKKRKTEEQSKPVEVEEEKPDSVAGSAKSGSRRQSSMDAAETQSAPTSVRKDSGKLSEHSSHSQEKKATTTKVVPEEVDDADAEAQKDCKQT